MLFEPVLELSFEPVLELSFEPVLELLFEPVLELLFVVCELELLFVVCELELLLEDGDDMQALAALANVNVVSAANIPQRSFLR